MRTGQNMLIDSNPGIPVDQHIITGDGRGNENIGLTAVHHVFHEEHNGQVANIRTSIETEAATILANEGAAAADAFLAQWQTAPGVWDGERLYQAARLITESEYNHIAIDQYVGTLYGALPEFVSYSSDINPGVSLEFSPGRVPAWPLDADRDVRGHRSQHRAAPQAARHVPQPDALSGHDRRQWQSG